MRFGEVITAHCKVTIQEKAKTVSILVVPNIAMKPIDAR